MMTMAYQTPQSSSRSDCILIVDDHVIYREGLLKLLEQDGYSVLQAGSVHDALEIHASQKIDATIVDLSFQGENGFVLIQQLLRNDEQARILVLTAHSVEEYVLKAFQTGAMGYAVKSDPAEEILFALRCVLGRRFYISSSLLHILVQRFLLAPPSPGGRTLWHKPLTRREQEVLEYAANGLKNREIAEKMGLNIETVEKHRHNGMRKLGADDRAKMRAMLQVIKAEMAMDFAH